MTKDVSWRQRLAARKFEEPPVPVPSQEQIRAVIARHELGIAMTEVSALPRIGTVNSTFALGERYVLRVPKPLGACDTRTESVAAPAARAAGVTTPALLVYDDSKLIFDVPYTIYERVHGENFGVRDVDPAVSGKVYREIGRQLAILHHGVTECPDPDNRLDEPRRADPGDLLEFMGTEAYLSSYCIAWLSRVFDRLRPAVAEARGFRRFLHNDVLPTNVMVKGDEFAALIDWNDAGWGDPAIEFAALPCRAFPCTLAGYNEVSAIDGEATVAHRVLWDHLCAALEFLLTPTDPRNISWARPPFARLTEITAMAARFEPWQELLG